MTVWTTFFAETQAALDFGFMYCYMISGLTRQVASYQALAETG